MTRSSAKTSQIEAAGAKPVVADVFDADEIDKAVADVGPEVVVSPADHAAEVGTQAAKDFEPAKSCGAGRNESGRRGPARRACAGSSPNR